MKLILASSSPRRKEILESLGLFFEIMAPTTKEEYLQGLSPEEIALHNACQKALEVARVSTEAIVIGADTIIDLDGRIFGKPQDQTEGIEMLGDLSGKEHKVITGIAVIVTRGGSIIERITEFMVTRVTMKELSNEEIREYIATFSPLDKAGSYAVQEIGDTFIEEIKGDYYNVLGLPRQRIAELLKTLFQKYGLS